MNATISNATSKTYKKAVKPLLFKQQPDTAHEHMLQAGTRLQSIASTRSLLHSMWAYDNPAALAQTLHGITFRNPVGLSAGFDKNFQLPPLIKAIGFGFMEGGSLTYHECAGNPRPWFYRLPKSQALVVNAGLANHGVQRIVERLRAYPAGTFKEFPLNISIAKTNSPGVCDPADAVADYVGSLTVLQQAKLGDMYTLNISCPNAYGGQPFTTPRLLERLLAAVDKLAIQQPVFIKMPSHLPWSKFRTLVHVAANHHVSGLTIANLTYREQVAVKDPLPDSVKGKLGGRLNQAIANDLIRRTYRAYGDRFTIVGVGGIFSAQDAYAKVRLGASLVELVTGMIFEGPQLIGQINDGLVRLLEQDGFTHTGVPQLM